MGIEIIDVAGADALQKLRELRANYASSGQYAFLIGGDRQRDNLLEASEIDPHGMEEILRYAQSIDAAQWLEEAQRSLIADGIDLQDFTGEWPGEIEDKGGIMLHKDVITRKLLPTVHIGLARIEQPWQLPAATSFGGWNECPEPAVQCALHRHWQNSYGAEIIGMSGDVIECEVANPPRDRAAAVKLATEQFLFCRDIVDQGSETIANLAATLMNSKYWFFWWD